MITVLYFAGLKEITNKEEEKVNWSNQTVKELMDWIEQTYQGFSNQPIHIAVNEEYVPLDYMIQSGDMVALIPPVSGG